MTIQEKREVEINKVYELLDCLRSEDLTKMATAKDMIKSIMENFE